MTAWRACIREALAVTSTQPQLLLVAASARIMFTRASTSRAAESSWAASAAWDVLSAATASSAWTCSWSVSVHRSSAIA